MIYTGKAHCFGDDINTDYITPSKYKAANISMEEYATHMMEDIRPGFYGTISAGDFIVAGKNFGCGSSRESASRVIQVAKISVILAKSFARIFFRNAIGIGLPVLECDTDAIQDGEVLQVNVVEGTVTRSNGTVIHGIPLPPAMMNCLQEGGMSAVFKKYHTFKL